MSIIALGYLRSRTHFDKLARYLDDRSTIISLSAARALMHIDPARAVTMLVPHIMARNDWPQGGVAQILHDASPELVSGELGQATLQANADVAPRLIRGRAGDPPRTAVAAGRPPGVHLPAGDDRSGRPRPDPLAAHPRTLARAHARCHRDRPHGPAGRRAAPAAAAGRHAMVGALSRRA